MNAPYVQCFNYGDWGHYSTNCDKPPRMGGEIYPFPSRLSNRVNDRSVEIKDAGQPGSSGSSKATAEEKGKGKLVSLLGLEDDGVTVLLLGK